MIAIFYSTFYHMIFVEISTQTNTYNYLDISKPICFVLQNKFVNLNIQQINQQNNERISK
jgi:hypothetical protein